MKCSRRGILFQAQIGILDGTFDAAFERSPKEIREAKIRSPRTPLVVERCLIGRDQPTSALDKIAELLALRIGERGNVWQDQRLKMEGMLGVEQPVVHHFEWNAGLDERLIPAEGMVFDFRRRALAAIEPGGLLRVDEANASERHGVAKVLFAALIAVVNVLDDFEPPWILNGGGKFREPWPQSVGNTIGHPDAKLCFTLERVFPTIGLFQADAENASDRFVAHRGAIFLAVLAVSPRGHQTAARLPIGKEDGCPLANFFHVERAGRSAARIGNDAGIGIELPHLRVPELPQFKEPLLAPEDISAAGGILRIGGPR